MSAQISREAPRDQIAPAFQDQTFEPRSSFEFDSEMRQPSSGMHSYNGDFAFQDGIYDDDLDQNLFGFSGGQFQMGTTTFGHSHGMTSFAPPEAWQKMDRGRAKPSSGLQVGQSLSTQGEIVNSRRSRVNEKYGQVTPPNDSAAESLKSISPKKRLASQEFEEEDIAKMNRTQRARNAANKRHSKPKTVIAGDSQDNEVGTGEGEQDPSKSTSLQREKNRVAAAKCRAKKKANSEEMQEVHRDGARDNSYLQREVRELRDQKAFLRNTLLQHEPGVCRCHAIHNFNMAQAQQLAFGVNAMYPPMSPSQDSAGSIHTPTSDMSAGRAYSGSGQSVSSRRMSVPSRPQSGFAPNNYTFGQITSPDPRLPDTNTTADPPQMPPQFSDFLHSSPRGRAGFS